MEGKVIQLTGFDLTLEQIREIVQAGARVEITPEAYERVQDARDLIFRLDKRGVPVYGLNTGVGWNKDKRVYAEFYDTYNKNLLKSHMIGVNPECSEEEVRAMMVIRLNGFLCGCTGVSTEIAACYAQFLNLGIHPVVKRRGSVGEADIGTLSAIALVAIGEWEANYRGKRMTGAEVLKEAGMKPFVLGPKDGLGMVSSNAMAASLATVAVLQAEHFIKVYHRVFCLSLEALNGVVDPLDASVNQARGYKGQIESSGLCREILKGSYLWEHYEGRALQDPLSFRNLSAVMGAVMDSMEYLKKQLAVEWNSTDDNPCLLPKEDRMCGCANFESLTWTFAVEMVTVAFAHVSKMIAQQTLRMVEPSFTQLPRFLSPAEGSVIAFGTIQKTFSILDTENRMYANPSSMDFLSLAGHIEDMCSNSGFAADKLQKLIDNLYYMMSIELMHAAQGIDLRRPPNLGKETGALYESYRKLVPHLEKDRNMSVDIQKTYDFLKAYDR